MAPHRDVLRISRQWAVTGHGIRAVDNRNGAFDVNVSRIWDTAAFAALPRAIPEAARPAAVLQPTMSIRVQKRRNDVSAAMASSEIAASGHCVAVGLRRSQGRGFASTVSSG
jgi:hypothetical protein